MNTKNTKNKTRPTKSLERLARQVQEANTPHIEDLVRPPRALDDAGFAEALRGVPVSTVIATVSLLATLSRRDRSRVERPGPLAMVVTVQSADWLNPVDHALSHIRRWDKVCERSGESRQEKPENGSDAIADVLGEGGSALGISTAPERYLPSALVSAADVRVTLGSPSPRALRWVIRTVTGRRPPPLPAGLGQGLTISEIASCVRRGTGATACVRRLEVATASKRADADAGLADVPLLQDAVGYDSAALDWGKQLVAAVKEYRAGTREWSSIEDRNIVLSGDTGVGKTVFARIIAKTAGVPLIATSVSAWFATSNGYLNDIVHAIDAVINQAIAAGPVVLLLDEIDAIPNRATVDNKYRDFWNTVCTHILLRLDSAVSGASSKLIVIGATNFPSRLDAALVRPGRLNKVVHIPRPSTTAIAGIPRHHIGSALAGEDLMPVATIADGATGAEAAGWARGARMAARAAGRAMAMSDLIDQVAPPETRSPATLLAVARHEAGHATATEVLRVGSVTNVSLVSRGDFAARTSARLHDATMMSTNELDAQVISLLAGRASDQHWGRVTSGAAGGKGSDLAHATGLVVGKHATWGLGGTLLYRGDATDTLLREPDFRRTVEADLDRLYEESLDLVRRNAKAIDRLAHQLVAKRVMTGDEIRQVIGTKPTRAGEDGAITTVGGLHA